MVKKGGSKVMYEAPKARNEEQIVGLGGGILLPNHLTFFR